MPNGFRQLRRLISRGHATRANMLRRFVHLEFEQLEERNLFSVGALDPTFGVGGKVITEFYPDPTYPFDGQGTAVAIQSDGKVVMGGSINFITPTGSGGTLLVRYMNDGTIDPTFGVNGRVLWKASDGGLAEVNAMAIQPNGKILVAGRMGTGSSTDSFGVARFNADGSVDAGFGAGGKASLDMFPGYSDANHGARTTAVAVQSDGRILVGGMTYDRTSLPEILTGALARFNSDGSVDASFGAGGMQFMSVPGVVPPLLHVVSYVNQEGGVAKFEYDFAEDTSVSLAVQADGKILAAGTGSAAGRATDNDFLVVRYHANGQLDASFGNNGAVLTDFGRNRDRVAGVAVQADGKIVVGGVSNHTIVTEYSDNFNPELGLDKIVVSGVSDFAIARLLPDGRLDTSFSADGKVVTDLGAFERATSILLQKDGAILLGGGTGPDQDYFGYGPLKFALARYKPNGQLDLDFGVNGKVITSFPEERERTDIAALAIQADGKIIAAGAAVDTGGGEGIGTYVFALARYIGSDVSMTSATTRDSKSVTVKYEVIDPSVKSFQIGIYKSGDNKYDGTDSQLKLVTISGDNATVGTHELTITLVDGALRPDPKNYPNGLYVLAVANPMASASTAYFRKWLVGVVTHGYTFGFGAYNVTDQMPWVDGMANDLKANGYDATITYDWQILSREKKAGMTIMAGRDLAGMVVAKAMELVPNYNGTGDVVDVHFIGHSRGTLVVAQAARTLQKGIFPQLVGGYLKLTLLDPHPAHNVHDDGATFATYAPGFSLNPAIIVLSLAAINEYLDFNSFARDPDLVIPTNADEVRVFYQQNTAKYLASWNERNLFNLWGEYPWVVFNNSTTSIKAQKLTDPTIGHGEVVGWYWSTFVKSGRTFAYSYPFA